MANPSRAPFQPLPLFVGLFQNAARNDSRQRPSFGRDGAGSDGHRLNRTQVLRGADEGWGGAGAGGSGAEGCGWVALPGAALAGATTASVPCFREVLLQRRAGREEPAEAAGPSQVAGNSF